VYAGRIDDRQKRVSDLLALAEALDRRRIEFALRIIGEGWFKPALVARWRELPEALRGRISIEPAISPPRVREALRESDVLVLASAYEGTSISMLEAMAEGCVPVVTAVSGTRAAIEEGVSGHAVAVGDVPAMAEVIAGLAGDRVRLAQMGEAAHARARRGCSRWGSIRAGLRGCVMGCGRCRGECGRPNGGRCAWGTRCIRICHNCGRTCRRCADG
jgi:glycosyltransferase involved in cell wall biosynthesis